MEEWGAALQRLGKRTLQENEQKTQSPDIIQETEGMTGGQEELGLQAQGLLGRDIMVVGIQMAESPLGLSAWWIGDPKDI